ncbi:MAG: O-antigen ligase family protein [Desulfomonilaceae bacterium]
MLKSMINGTSRTRTVSFIVFCLTTVQLVFLKPYIIIYPSQRGNVFSATLCLFAFVVTILLGRKKPSEKLGPDMWISIALGLIIIFSSVFSVAPRQSMERAYVILLAGLAGYWCSKFLLSEPKFLTIFQWMVNGLLLCVIFLALLGLYLTGRPHEFLDGHWHPVGSRLLLMSFAPLSLLFGDGRRNRIIGGTILLIDLIAIYIVGRYAFMESMLLIPAILCIVAFFLFKWEKVTRKIFAVILVTTIFLGIFFACLNPKKLNRDHISVSYRIESLFFSFEIACRHPWLGNGLWAPRISFLKDYTLHYPYLSKDQFSKWVVEYKTSEDMYLTFLADLGILFFILYFGSVLYILVNFFQLSRKQTSWSVFHPAAILLPLIAECLRFLVLDDLFHPQSSWFFHVLLGLAARGSVKKDIPDRP